MNTLRGWVTLAVTAIVGLGTLSFAVRYYQVLLDWTARDALADASGHVIRFGRWIHADGSPQQLQASALEALDERIDGVAFAILDPSGNPVPTLTTPGLPEPASLVALPADARTNSSTWHAPRTAWVTDRLGRRYATAWFPLGHERSRTTPPPHWSVAVVSQPDPSQRLATLRASLALRIAGLTVGTGFLTFFMVGLWTRSLASAADAATRLAHGDLGLQRLDRPKRDSELRHLVDAFNILMERLHGMHTAQQRFVADAAHELRTPLTILRGEIQVALRKDRDPEKYQAVLRSNLEEVVRLSHLVEALLTLARVDAHASPGDLARVEVLPLCHAVVDKLQPTAEARGIRLIIEADSEVPLHARVPPDALHRCLFNLADNAVRFSSQDDCVLIRVNSSGTTIQIEVIDEGPGIAQEHLPHLFERFYRVESARNRASGGVGLGLAIAKALAEAHGGRIQATSEVGTGSAFTLTIPRTDPPKG